MVKVMMYSINIISDQNNCIDPQELNLDVGYDDENCLWIPTLFTPNMDGVNDTFEIYGMEYYPNAVVDIYNRWGIKIYESNNEQEIEKYFIILLLFSTLSISIKLSTFMAPVLVLSCFYIILKKKYINK